MEAPEKAICLPIPWARLLTDRDLWRDWRLSQDAPLPSLQITCLCVGPKVIIIHTLISHLPDMSNGERTIHFHN